MLEGNLLWKRFTREDYKVSGDLWEKVQGEVGGVMMEMGQTLRKLSLGL